MHKLFRFLLSICWNTGRWFRRYKDADAVEEAHPPHRDCRFLLSVNEDAGKDVVTKSIRAVVSSLFQFFPTLVEFRSGQATYIEFTVLRQEKIRRLEVKATNN